MEAHVDRRYNCIVDNARDSLFALRANVESWRALTKKFTEGRGNRWKPVSPSHQSPPSYFVFLFLPPSSSFSLPLFSSFNRHKSSLPNRISHPFSWISNRLLDRARNPRFRCWVNYESGNIRGNIGMEISREKVENLYRWSFFAAGFIAGRWRPRRTNLSPRFRGDLKVPWRYARPARRMLFRVPRNRNPRQIVDGIVSTKLNRLAGCWVPSHVR